MDSLRIRSRWLSRAILGVLIMLLVMPTLVAIAVISGRPYIDLLIRQLPMIFYAWALWSIRGALSGYASGGSLSMRASRTIQVVGLNLFLSSSRFNKRLPELYRHVLPFLAILGVGVLLITYIPEMSLGLLRLLGKR